MNNETKEREYKIPIENVWQRIVALAILAILGGPDIISAFVPGMGGNPDTIIQLEKLSSSIKNTEEDLSHEIMILHAEIEETKIECKEYTDKDRDSMESIRSRINRLEYILEKL